MDVVVARVAGLDIGKASMTVCVRTPGPGQPRTNEVRTYSTMTRQIETMGALAGRERSRAGRDGIHGEYWKPVFYHLEEVVETWLLNAAHIKPSRAARATCVTRSGSTGWSSTAWSFLLRAAAGDPPATEPDPLPPVMPSSA